MNFSANKTWTDAKVHASSQSFGDLLQSRVFYEVITGSAHAPHMFKAAFFSYNVYAYTCE